MFTLGQKMLRVAMLSMLAALLFACGSQTAAPAAPTAAPAAPTAAPAAPTAAPAAAETSEIVVAHAQGETTITKNPQTVLVFDYSVLDTLDQFGVAVAGLPQGNNIPPFLEKYKGSEYANIGTLFEPDYEKVNDLKADLIIVAGRSAAVYPELAKIAPTIDLTIDQSDFYNSVVKNVNTLASIFGKEELAATKLAELDATVKRTQALAAEKGQNGLILMVSGGNVTAYGPGSRFGIIHDLLGVAAVTDGDEIKEATHGDAISFEFIQEKNPDILFVVDRDTATGDASEPGQAAKEVLDNELVAATNAWKNGQITYLDPSVWYLANAGLNSFGQMINEIEAALQ